MPTCEEGEQRCAMDSVLGVSGLHGGTIVAKAGPVRPEPRFPVGCFYNFERPIPALRPKSPVRTC